MSASIGIDATFIAPGAVGGAEHMLRNLVGGLAEAFPEDDYVLFARGDWWTSPAANVSTVSYPTSRNRFLAGWQAASAHVSSLDAILFANYFTAPLRRSRPRIVTVIHDLQYRHFPRYFTARKRTWLRAAHELTLRRADVVATGSDFVREDLLAQYGTHWAGKVRTVPYPISWQRFECADASPEGEKLRAQLGGRPYILCVSAHYPHKNLETLLRAFALYRRVHADDGVALVLVGQRASRLVGTSRGPALESVAEELGVTNDLFVVGYADDGVTGELYRGALAFVMPSLFEGFGMPAVEALGFGLPVVATRAGALPEATLGLALYVDDPRRPEEFADALANVASNPQRYRPHPNDVARIRARYDPLRIARTYRQLLVGDDPYAKIA